MEGVEQKKPKAKQRKRERDEQQPTNDIPGPVPIVPQLHDFDALRSNIAKEVTEEEQSCSSTASLQSETNQNSRVSTEAPKSKNEEVRISSSNFPVELPLDALLPRCNSNEATGSEISLNSANSALKTSQAVAPTYPSLNSLYAAQIIAPKISIEAPICDPPAYEACKYPSLIVEDSAPSCESIVQFSGETELLTEGQLLEYYKNEQLNFVDDFADEFVEEELEPHNSLYELLEKFKNICDRLQQNEDAKTNTVRSLTALNNEVWEVGEKKVAKKGRCGDDRSAYGEVSYKVANLKPEKLVALQEDLDKLTDAELDQALCLEIRSRALALQIQWLIVEMNKNFLMEHQLSLTSMPLLLSALHCLPTRKYLRGALSDLFHFMRNPMLPSRFRDSAIAWIIEVTSVLFKACTTDDQMFLLCHILRLPSPLSPWAVPLVQTYIATPNLNMSTPMNTFVAMMCILMNPIKYRDQFLNRVMKFYEGENSWDLIGDDGDVDTTHVYDLTETDLIDLLAQFSIRSLFSVCLKYFTFIHQGNRLQIMLSLVSFVLVLLKIFDEGLLTYAAQKNTCKKICDYIRKLIQYYCNYWDLVKSELKDADRVFLQNEVNRVVLQAVYYIVSKKAIWLWQFVVDFPFSSVTEYCRQRIILLLRNITDSKMNVREVYKIPDNELINRIKSGVTLVDLIDNISSAKEVGTYCVSVLSSVTSYCETEQTFFALEIVHLCFLDETTREHYYKVGSESISVMIGRNPSLLSSLLKYIDRHVDHLDEYATDILTSASLANCQLSVEDVANILGKWLINRSVNHPASNIARRVLTSLNWGIPGDLWLSQDVHDICADNIVKAHIVHCKGRNSSIAKSVSKATKIATRCADLEQAFDKFCWDVLIKLKVSAKPLAPNPTNDLTAFYLFIQQKCLSTPDIFLEYGLKYFLELVNSSSFNASIVILSQLISIFPNRLHLFLASPIFCDCVYRVIHADESSYAVQLIVGADKFPGPCLSLISSAITYQINEGVGIEQKKKIALAWMSLLTCPKTVEWNADKFVLHLIGSITRIAFLNDPDGLFGLEELVEKLYNIQLKTWRDSSRGPLSWFSSAHIHPQIIAPELLSASPWASYLLLKVEPKSFSDFYHALEISLGKHEQRTLDEAVKKASAKSHLCYGIERLHYYRWLQFVSLPEVTQHEIFPLALQQFCLVMFARKEFEKKRHCPGHRYFKCPHSEHMFTALRSHVLPKVEKNLILDDGGTVSTKQQKLSSFYHAASQWIFTESVYNPNLSNFNDFTLDYLLQMCLSGDSHPWLEFVDMDNITRYINEEVKVFTLCCHLKGVSLLTVPPASPTSSRANSLTQFFTQLELPTLDSVAFPSVPIHHNLPISEKIELSDCYNLSGITKKFSVYLEELNKAARTYIAGKETVETLNHSYLEQFQKLYVESQRVLQVSLKCGNFLMSKCSKPVNTDVTVTLSTYDQQTADKMNESKRKREEEIGRLLMMVDTCAIQSAHQEHICASLARLSDIDGKIKVMDQLRVASLSLFYRICTTVSSQQLLFPAGVECYNVCLEKIGMKFVSNNPAEQLNLMRIVLGGNPLNHFLARYFTPHNVEASLLFQLYSELSNSVRNASTSESALSLLSRLDIEHAGEQMPPNQFSALMPVIFENLASVTSDSPLQQLCIDHFIHAMFHQFPQNFPAGLRLVLTGCDSQAVPVEVFQLISVKLEADALLSEEWSLNITALHTKLSFEKAHDCIRVISAQLGNSRHLLTTRFYSVWAQYLEIICKLADYFLRLVVFQKFRNDLATVAIENDLRDTFYVLVSVWAPLLEPVNSGLAPWNSSDNPLASVVIDRLLTNLNWLPHNIYLPPGTETVEALFWQYFSSRLLGLQRAGTAHIFSVYELKLVRLVWSRFWPTLLDLSTMEKALTDGSPDVAPIIVEIIVRIPWVPLIQHQENQPEDAHRAFHSLILSITARCVYRSSNYAKSRASVESLLRLMLDNCKWYYAKVDAVDAIGKFIVGSFPNDCLTQSNEVIKAFFCIWREVCFFSTVTNSAAFTSAKNVDEKEKLETIINRKRAVYIRTVLQLMIKGTSTNQEDQAKFYKEIISKTNQFFTATDKLQYLCLARELTGFWPDISKHTEVMMKALTEWLSDHSESCMVLLILNTAMDSLASSAIQHGLRLLNSCIQIYFQRRLSCQWSEVSQWIQIPERSKEWLYTTPRSESGVQPCFFVLNAHLMKEMSQLKSAKEESQLLKRIAEYIQAVKPKYVTSEPAFLLCVEKWLQMVIRQFANGVNLTVANENTDILLRWLKKIHTEEKGVSFFSAIAKFGKKPTFSARIQLIAGVMDYYITQQQLSPTMTPRTQKGQAVLNSRIQAFRELQQQKAYQEFAPLLNNITSFFVQVDSHTLNETVELFNLILQGLYPDEKVLRRNT